MPSLNKGDYRSYVRAHTGFAGLRLVYDQSSSSKQPPLTPFARLQFSNTFQAEVYPSDAGIVLFNVGRIIFDRGGSAAGPEPS